MTGRVFAHSSGLDISLLGVIVAGIGLSLDRVVGAAGTMPHLLRFFDKPPGTQSPALMPQDAALLLLVDPSTAGSQRLTGATPIIAVGDLPLLIAFIGVILVVVGPLWAWRFR